MDKSQRNKIFYHACVTFVALALSIAFFFLLYRFGQLSKMLGKMWTAISPFAYGAAIAYVLGPACDFFEAIFVKIFTKCKMKHPRKPANAIAVVLTLVFAIMTIYFLVASLLPQLFDSIGKLVGNLDLYATNAQEWAEDKLKKWPDALEYFENSIENGEDYITNWLSESIMPNLQTIIGNVSSGVVNVFDFIKTAFISVIVAAYVMIGRKKVVGKISLLLKSILKEKQYEVVWEELEYTDRMFSGFISGKIIDSAIIGVLTFITLTIWNMFAGFDYIVLISVVIGLTNIIPFFGPFIGAIPCAFLILLESPMKCLGFIIFVIILQQVDGNILGPKILGNATGISSFGVLFAVLFFGSLWGFIGMLVGVPVFGVLSDIVCKFVEKGLRKHEHDELADIFAAQKRAKMEMDGKKPSVEEKWRKRMAPVRTEWKKLVEYIRTKRSGKKDNNDHKDQG